MSPHQSVDMWAGFVKVIEATFPNAKIVYDRFHVMQQVNRELNKLRKLMKVTKKGIKFLLLSNVEKLQKEEREKLNKILV